MPEWKGHRLYVNLGASQARRRLKGFGHGVRKVQSAGRNQAMIIHTATGQHLRELEALFADVPIASNEDELLSPVENLRNLGPQSAAWLHSVGLHTIADLERLGPVTAYQVVKTQEPTASLNFLWALAAGLRDQDWRELSEDDKRALRQQLDQITSS